MTSNKASEKIILGIGPFRMITGLALAAAWIVLCNMVVISNEVPCSTPINLVDEASMVAGTPAELAADVPSNGSTYTLGFVGDIMQHRGQMNDDFVACYKPIKPLIDSFDLAIGNLEFPVHPGRAVGPRPLSTTFNGDSAHLDALVDAGFDVLSTANNHAFDQGMEGVAETLNLLTERGIVAVGTCLKGSFNSPVLVPLGDLRIVFVAYKFSPNSNQSEDGSIDWWPNQWPINELNFHDWDAEYRQEGQQMFAEHIQAAQSLNGDFVIALVHWGREWHLQPSHDQVLAAHDMIDAGFDLVVGGHSHVLNPPEVYRGKLIAYSLGNFISDFVPLETRVGAVLSVQLSSLPGTGAKVTDFKFFPTLTQRQQHRVAVLSPNRNAEEAEAWVLANRILGSSTAAFEQHGSVKHDDSQQR